MSSYWGNGIGNSLAIPGTAPADKYNVINLAFWLSSGPADAATVWSTIDGLGTTNWGSGSKDTI
jgi:hypothetical protein